MIWENLTIDEFDTAVKESKGVVLVPFGCLEKHGSHMPIGTDIFVARYYFNMTTKTIAKCFGMEHATVRSQLLRTRTALRKYLKENDIDV